MTEVKILKYVVLPQRDHDDIWEFYGDTFDPINPYAAMRHRLNGEEFDTLALDPAVEKYVAYNDHGEIIGLSMQTSRLLSWPGVSDEYFERRYPAQVAAGRFWYVVFVGAAARGRPHHTFGRLLQEMTANRRDGGIWGMDFCRANLDRGILELIKKRLCEFDERTRISEEDRQVYYVIDFPATTS